MRESRLVSGLNLLELNFHAHSRIYSYVLRVAIKLLHVVAICTCDNVHHIKNVITQPWWQWRYNVQTSRTVIGQLVFYKFVIPVKIVAEYDVTQDEERLSTISQ